MFAKKNEYENWCFFYTVLTYRLFVLLRSFDRGIFSISIDPCFAAIFITSKISSFNRLLLMLILTVIKYMLFFNSYWAGMKSHIETFFIIATCIVMAGESCKMCFGLSMKKTATISAAVMSHDPLLRRFQFQLSDWFIYPWSVCFSFLLTNNDFSFSKFLNHFLVRIMFDLFIEKDTQKNSDIGKIRNPTGFFSSKSLSSLKITGSSVKMTEIDLLSSESKLQLEISSVWTGGEFISWEFESEKEWKNARN